MNVLWLTSWYPNRLDKLNGDFVQRHANALARFCNVHVIHVEPDKENKLTTLYETSISTQGNLTEEIILYKLSSLPVIGKYFSFRRYKALFKKSIKAYVTHNGKPAIVHVHVPMKAGILALWVKKEYDINYIVTEHWGIYNDRAADAYSKRNIFFKYFTKKILQNAAMFTPVTRQLGEAVQQLVAPVPFTVVPNVANTSIFNLAKPQPNENKVFTFFHASTLEWHKNPRGILNAFAGFIQQHPFSRLIMAGSADDELRDYTSSLNIATEKIIFPGFVTHARVAELMKQSDAFIMFSRYENMPCVIAEALCCGLPVISSNVGGISEAINNANGLLIPSEDEEKLLQAMLSVYNKYNLFNRPAIAKNASQTFSYDIVGSQIYAIYQQFKNQT